MAYPKREKIRAECGLRLNPTALSQPGMVQRRGLWARNGMPEHFLLYIYPPLTPATIPALINRVGAQPIEQAVVVQGVALVKVQEEMLRFCIARR